MSSSSTTTAPLPLTQEQQLAIAKEATRHLLNAICDDPAKYWLMGYGTGSYDKLTAAHAALWNVDVEQVRKNFVPTKKDYERYLKKIEAERSLLEYCEENNITVPRDEDDE